MNTLLWAMPMVGMPTIITLLALQSLVLLVVAYRLRKSQNRIPVNINIDASLEQSLDEIGKAVRTAMEDAELKGTL